MPSAPEVAIVRIDHGIFPEASRLNHRISPSGPLLVATLDVFWRDPNPRRALAALEDSLSRLSSTFRLHECRGPHAYHVFSKDRSRPAAASRRRLSPGPRQIEPHPFDASLALAHLIEHAVIDFQCYMTGQKRCSGLTGAHRNTPGRYDLMIECRDFVAGRCSLALAVAWLTAGSAGHRFGDEERIILRTSRFALRRGSRPLTAPAASRALGVKEGDAEAALLALCQVGFVTSGTATMNFSGIPEYRIAAAPPCGPPCARQVPRSYES